MNKILMALLVACSALPFASDTLQAGRSESRQMTPDFVADTARATDLRSKTDAELWSVYKDQRRVAEEEKLSGDFRESIRAFSLAGRAAVELERPGIAAWQFNNAAKHAIDWYKELTAYDSLMATVEAAPAGEEKVLAIGQAKEMLKRHQPVLLEARAFLEKALRLDEKVPDAKRAGAINQNMMFVAFVQRFLG